MIYFLALDESHWPWFKERAHAIRCEDTCGIVAIGDDGAIQAAAVFDSFTPTTCMTHMAIDNPRVLKYGMLVEVANYLFLTRERERIFGSTPSDNAKALKFNKHIGWEELYRVENGFRVGVDSVIQVMTKDSCPWLLDKPAEEVA